MALPQRSGKPGGQLDNAGEGGYRRRTTLTNREDRMAPRHVSRAIAASLVVLAALLLTPAARAQAPAEQACAGDIKAFCANVPQGEGRVAQCLRANQAKLSPGCQKGMGNTATLMKEVVQACEDDVHRFCAGAAPGTIKDCLRNNFRELSFGCKRELFEAKKGM
jgi:cysteine rich repeat protein